MPKLLIAFIIFFAIGLIVTGVTFFSFSGDNSGGEFNGKDATLFVSRDGGETWKGVEGTGKIWIISFARAFGASDKIYAGTRSSGLLELDAKTLKLSAVGSPEGGTEVLDVAAGANGAVYAAVFQDNSASIVRVENGSSETLYKSALDGYGIFGLILDNGNIFAASGSGDFLKGDIKEKTWQVVSRTADGITHLEAHPFISGKFWAVGDKGTFYSTVSSGNLWNDRGRIRLEKIRNVGKIYDMKFDKQRSSLLVGTDYGIIESDDDGLKWRDFKSPIPPNSIPVTAVEAHPQFAEIFWFAARNVVYRTHDGGVTWSSSVLPREGTVSVLFADTVNPDTIYAGFSK